VTCPFFWQRGSEVPGILSNAEKLEASWTTHFTSCSVLWVLWGLRLKTSSHFLGSNICQLLVTLQPHFKRLCAPASLHLTAIRCNFSYKVNSGLATPASKTNDTVLTNTYVVVNL
jgi:hypothetical protein